ncbi:hypothetical protein K501DRAFT_158965, partial [Backusella circina FSU 941]
EDGHGNYYDEKGNYAVDVEMEDDADELESLVILSCYEQRNPGTFDPARRRRRIKGKAAVTEDVEKSVNATKRPSNSYTDKQRHLFIWLLEEKLLSAAAAAREVGDSTRTGQSWTKAYRDDPEKKVPMPKTDKKRGPKPTFLATDHKSHAINYIDENATATVSDAMDSLTNAFMDLKLTKSSVQQFRTNECNLSFKKVQLHAVKRNSPETIQQRYDWAMKYQGTAMDFLTNCVFIDESAFYINLKRSY